MLEACTRIQTEFNEGMAELEDVKIALLGSSLYLFDCAKTMLQLDSDLMDITPGKCWFPEAIGRYHTGLLQK